MVRYNCKICGFSSEKMKLPEICPYCGKQGEIKEEETIEELIKEA